MSGVIWDRKISARVNREGLQEDEAGRQEERRKTSEEVRGCSAGQYAEGWSDRGACWDRRRWRQMVHCDNPLREQPIEDDDWCHNRFSIYPNKDYTSQIFRNL